MAQSSKSSDSVIPGEVRDLIQESQKIQGWVERLAEHSDEARPEVFQKVLADYERRLAGVNGSLAEYRTQLVDTVETRRNELEALRADRDEQAADLEEAKLRHAVGEYDDSEWEDRREKVQETLDDLDELLSSEEVTVGELDEIIASIASTGTSSATPTAGVVDAAGIAEIDELPEPESVSAEADLGDVVEGAEEAGGETVAEDEVIEAEAPETAEDEVEEAVAEAEAPTGDGADADGEGGDYLDELEFLESLSLGDADRFDAVSAMLDDEEGGKKSE